MSYELSDKMILRGELMKYRRSLCEQVSEYGGFVKSVEQVAMVNVPLGLLLKVWSINLTQSNAIKRVELKS